MKFKKIKNPTIFPIDFTKPWWQLIAYQKGTCFCILAMTAIYQVFTTITPFLAALIFESHGMYMCFVIFGIWFILDILQKLARQQNPKFQLQCIYSIYQAAHLHLLSVDPQYHVHRSSGAILGKIDRGARGCEDLLDQITDDFTPLIFSLITVIIMVVYYSYTIAAIMALFIISIISIGYYFTTRISASFEKDFLKSDDACKTTAVENLAQIQLIRSTFAADFRSQRLKNNVLSNVYTEGALWLSYSATFHFLALLHLASLFILAVFLVWQVNHSLATTASAIGLFLSYMQGTKMLVVTMKLFRKTMRSLAAIHDLFAFIPAFGKQQIPVFGDSQPQVVKTDPITISAENIHFDYGGAVLYNNHSFAMTAAQEQPNKLYGIIGPSGVGKTTFLSILGGQLKPISGSVVIDNIDIYQTSDAVRRQLIALQGQVATNVKGTVKDNLLLGLPEGLPEEPIYSDDELLAILDAVGLFAVLSTYKGLQTKIGEGGLNLSGGQRQRLNFAALYLRATYYKPSVLLIDEPTSSLDEISEVKITEMMSQLARSAITLVIAHRLKTVEGAAGLIDLSELADTHQIKAYSAQELLRRSAYYRSLIEGSVVL